MKLGNQHDFCDVKSVKRKSREISAMWYVWKLFRSKTQEGFFYRSLCVHYWNFLHIQVDHCKWKNFTVADIGRDTLVAQTQQYILHKVTLQKFDAG